MAEDSGAADEKAKKLREKNAWILLVALLAFVLFSFLVPIRDNPKQSFFKQTLWDMVVGNRGTQVVHPSR